MFSFLYQVIRALEPIWAPLGAIAAWAIVILLGWSLVSAARDTIARARRMHEIPCANCRFFTNDYRLKCAVKPTIANTEAAIGCSDYNPKGDAFSSR